MNIRKNLKKHIALMLSLVLTFSSMNYATIANSEEVYSNDDVSIKVDRIFTDEVNSLSLKLEVFDTEETVSNVSITKENEELAKGEESNFYDKIYDNQSVKYEVAYYKEVSDTTQSEKGTDIITISQEKQTFEFEVIVDELENDLEDIKNEEIIVEEVEEIVEKEVDETNVLSTIEEELLTTLSNEVNVSNYGELQAAFKNSAVSKINFTDNIIRQGNIYNKLAPVNRSLEINGNGYYIDFTGAYDEAIVLDRVTTETEFSIRDLQVTGFNDEKQILNEYLIRHKYNTFDPNSKHVWADNWDIKLHNLSTYQNSAQRGIVKASDSKVTITGDLNWKSNSKWTSIIASSTSGVLVARDFNITDGARVNISAIKDIFNSSPAKLDSEIKFTVDKGSLLDLYSEDRSTIWVGKEATYNPIKVNITGQGTSIKARANYYGHENADSVIGFTGFGTKVESYVNITDGAVLDVKSTNSKSFLNGRSAPGIISQIRDGQFNVSGEGTRIDVESLGADDVLGATFRFRIVGNQRLNISDGAEMNVRKVGKLSQAPAMRFWGGGNELFVTSGGKLSVYNEGNGRAQDPGGDARNQGIQYIGSGVSTQFFSVKGAGSAIDIIANYGPAVDIDGLGQSYIEVADEASFVARGNTFSKLGAIFHSLKVEFVTDNPLYYDFANTRVGGGKVFNTTTLSTYESKDSDLAVWKIGDDINGDPHKSWSLIDFTLSGTHFKDIKSTSHPDIFNKNADSFGKDGMSDKSRISGNNARSIVDEFYTPENANKFFYGHVSVPEGATQGYRDAWTDEAFVELEVVEPNGTVTKVILPTIGKSATEPGVSVYGEEARGGIFVYEHNKFIEPGTTFEVVRAWRGNEDPNGDGVHESLPSDIKTSKVVAKDTTPPLPATIDNDVFYEINSELSGKWSVDESHNSDLVVDGKILVNDVEVLSTFTVNSDYTWNAIIDESVDLNPKDIIQVILIDENGNENPTTTVDYHDTTFIEGPKLQITKAEYILTATDKIIGRADAKAIKTDVDLLKLIEASAIYVPDSSKVDVEVISSDFKAEAGTYTIEVAVAKNKSINRTVTVEVLPYDNVVIGEDYIIGANDFYLSYRNAEDLSNLELIEKANAKAFRKDDYTVMSDVSVVYNGIKNVEGVYDVAFAVVNEPSTIVTSKAIVFKNDIVVESDDYIIVADHFALDLEQVENLDDNLLITSANARAFKKGDMSEVNVEVKSHQIIDEVGKYEVIFNIEDEKDTTVEVLAHVFNEVDEVNQIGWSGINAILKLDELSDGAVKASTRIKAFDISDLTNVEELDNNLITVSNLPTGVTDFYGHDVIFRIENNGNTSRFDLTVYVFDDVITETSGRNLSNSSRQNGYAINAYNFEAVSGNVVTRKQVKDLASVDIFKITNGSVKPMPELRDDATVNPFPLLKGVNKMTYSFAFDNNVIKAEKTAIIRDTDISLQTKNAVISLADANSLTNEQLIDLVVKSVSHSDSTITADQIKVEPFPLAVGKNYVNYSFECNNNVIQTTKVATISDSDIMLEMKNAIVDLDTAQTITEEQLKDLVVSKVGHIDSSVNVDDITVSISNNALNELNGLLKANTDGIIVEFTAKYGLDEVSMTSTVYVFDEVDNSNSDFVIGWTGNDAFTKLAELSEDKVREVTNVKAFNVTNPERITQIDDKDITLSNVPTGVSIEGTLVEFSVTNQLHTSKHNQLVYVFDDVVTNPKGEMIAYTGKDYATTIDKLEESDEYFISKNEIKYLN